MPIVAYLGKTINDYMKNAIDLLNALVFYCPVCGEKMGYHCSYPRQIKENGVTIRINRLICQNTTCNKTQAVLPDFVAPYKHYSANEIESVLLDSIDTEPESIDTPASIATVRRWLNDYETKTTDWISNLKAILLSQTGKLISELRFNGHFMDHLALILEELPPIKKSGNVLGAALIYICAYPIHKFT